MDNVKHLYFIFLMIPAVFLANGDEEFDQFVKDVHLTLLTGDTAEASLKVLEEYPDSRFFEKLPLFEKNYFLHVGCLANNLTLVRHAIVAGANLHKHNSYFHKEAVKNGYDELAKLLRESI